MELQTSTSCSSSFCSRMKHAFNLHANACAIFKRPAENYAVLDGVRAIAVLWVFAFHAMVFTLAEDPNSTQLSFIQSDLINFLRFTADGTMGVDLFFILSGFLIATILLREARKCGKIAYFSFLFRRVLRLWPALAVTVGLHILLLMYSLKGGAYQTTYEQCSESWWWTLLFIMNFQKGVTGLGGCPPQTWSVASLGLINTVAGVEFQFYLISPLLVYAYSKRRRVGVALHIAVLLLSVAARALLMWKFEVFSNLELSASAIDKWSLNYIVYIYQGMYTRCGPYVLGMLLAYSVEWCNSKDVPTAHIPLLTEDSYSSFGRFAISESIQYESSTPMPELQTLKPNFATVGMHTGIAIAVLFAWFGNCSYIPPQNWFSMPLVWGLMLVLNRILFATGVCVTLFFCLIKGSGGSNWLRTVLSHYIWYPIATLSYSGYLLQLIPALELTSIVGQPFSSTAGSLFLYFVICWLLLSAMALAAGAVMYIFVERPCMSLRPKRL